MKHPVKMAAYYNGTWNDITERVRTAAGITIVRGQQDEGSGAKPGRMTFTVDNRDGWGLPTSPASPFYAGGGRYVPVMCWLEPGLTSGAFADATDTFGRTSAAGWGSADSGQAWQSIGAGGSVLTTDWSVGSGQARHYVNAAAAYRITYLDTMAIEDFDSVHTIVLPQATGAPLESELIYRRRSTGAYGSVRVTVTTANAVQVQAYRADGAGQIGATVTTGITHAGTGAPLRLRVRAVGQVILARVWLASGSEPTTWTASFTDPSLVLAGAIGIRTGRASGNTNAGTTTANYDSLTVKWLDVRAVQEINTWTPRVVGNFPVASWTTGVTGTRGDATTAVTAAGILHRLNAGDDPLRNTLEEYVTGTTGLVGYWPLDDASAPADTMTNRVTGGFPAAFTIGQYVPRGAVLEAWLGPGVRSNGAATASLGLAAPADVPLTSTVNTATFVVGGLNQDSAVTAFVFGSDSTGAATINSLLLNGATGQISLGYIQASPSKSATLHTGNVPRVFDGRAHQISLAMQDSGADVNYFLYVDGTLVYASTVTTLVWRPIYEVDLVADGQATFGHLAVWSRFEDPESTLWDAARGYPAESPQERFARLCTLRGIPYSVLGSNTDAMGPQRPRPIVALLTECAATADALLYEPRNWLGLVLRGRDVMAGQAAAFTAPYAGGGVQLVMPVVDTRDNATTVTVTNDGGEEVTAESAAMITTLGGRVPTGVDVNYYTGSGLDPLRERAGWELSKRAVLAARYPAVTFDLDDAPAYATTAGQTELGRRFVITGLEPDPVGQIIRATTESIGSHRRTLTVLGTPDTVWQTGVYDTSRYDSGSSATTGAPNSTQTTFLVSTTNSRDLWGTGAVSFDILVGGERMTVSNVSGATSPQTFTVTRSVNGVVKAHTTGTAVRLATPARYGL